MVHPRDVSVVVARKSQGLGADQITEFASTVFARLEDNSYVTQKNRNGDLIIGGKYSEQFVRIYSQANTDVVIV